MTLLKTLRIYFVCVFAITFVIGLFSVPRYILVENGLGVYLENNVSVLCMIAVILSLIGFLITGLAINKKS